jgi:2-polyprenyl-3-methyl-5-hydroxy-6-metoxy-1,4-benzoquinol methylase
MNQNKKSLLFKAKDHLVSGEEFEIFWDDQKQFAATQIDALDCLERYYDSPDYISHQDQNQSLFERLYGLSRKIMLAYKYRLIKKVSPHFRHLLDMGCGTGVFLNHMKQNGHEVFGVENNSKARKICLQNKLKVVKKREEFSSQTFDVITLWHVLEHLPRPEAEFQQFYESLQTKGTLVIAVPNFESHDSHHYQHRWAALDVPRHLWHFTPEGLVRMAKENGFELIDIKPLWLDVFYICFLSEKLQRKAFAFLRGMIKAIGFTVIAFFTGRHSSLVFIFKKQLP